MVSVFVWWLTLQVVGILALPMVLKLLRFLPDRGLGFARHVGLLLVGYLFWLLVILGILQNTTSSIVVVLVVIGSCSAWIYAREGREMVAFLKERRSLLLITEAVFLLSLAALAVFRAYNPDIAYTEKPMEFGFLNAILRSRTFPPRDPWLAGYSISYYYFGYILIAILTRLSRLPSDTTFNLAGITLFALTVNGAFSLVYNLVQAFLHSRSAEHPAPSPRLSIAAVASGLLGSLFVALLGNLEGVFELIRARGLGSQALWQWLDVRNLQATPASPTWYPNDPWWWWRASRVIHDKDAMGGSMEVISEFPFFSFLLGDNHPHVLTLPFVFLVLALALNLLLSKPRGERALPVLQEGNPGHPLLRWVEGLWHGGLLDVGLWALLLGSLGFLNTWDYPIYLAILVAAYAVQRQSAHPRLGREWMADVITWALIFLGAGLLLYLPFYYGFRSQAGGLGLVGAQKTRLHQYLLMFGTFIFVVAGLLVVYVLGWLRQEPVARRLPVLAQVLGLLLLGGALFSCLQGWWTAALLLTLIAVASALLMWGARSTGGDEGKTPLDPSSIFALLAVVSGLLLTLSVEFVFLRDTFGTRMNTVFKFYYQAWALLGIASAYGVFRLAHKAFAGRGLARIPWAILLLIAGLLTATGLVYTVTATVSKANAFQGKPTLDGTRYVAEYRPNDYAAIQWLRAHAPLDAVMVEAPGGSYSEYNWVSAHTGIPTILGWGGHELQWRGNYDEASRREPDIAAIYQGTDVTETLALLEKYGIDYVYLGRLERDKYRMNPQAAAKFDRIMERVFEQGDVAVYGWRR